MAVREILPFTNLKDADIRDTRNKTGGVLDMWSRFKPVISKKLFYSESEWRQTGYRGADGKCGLYITEYNPETFKDAVKRGEGSWMYIMPSGGTEAPIRMGDYRGYCYTAYNPIGAVATNGLISNGKVTFAIDSAISGSSETNLTLADIHIGGEEGIPLSEYYLGIFLWKGSDEYFYTSDVKVGSSFNLNVEIPVSSTGEFYYVPFLSSSIQSGNGDVATIVSCNKKMQKVTIRGASTLRMVQPTGSWNISNTQVSVGAFLHNTGSSTTTFTGIVVELWEINSNGVEQKVKIANYGKDVVVSANSMASIDFDNPIQYAKKENCDYYLLGYSNETTESGYGEIDGMEASGFSLMRLNL